MPITEKMLAFLCENRLRDSRDWFAEHRAVYKALVEEPLLALSAEICGGIAQIDPLMTLVPRKTISRVWRDVRFSRDKTTFREVMWLVFRRGRGMDYPAYFFEFSPDFYRYGVGYYSAPPKVMQLIHEWVLADDPRYQKAQSALDALPGFTLEGDLYKRERFPGATETQRNWLDRKGLAVIRNATDPDLLFSAELGQALIAAFGALAPVYEFLVEAHLSVNA